LGACTGIFSSSSSLSLSANNFETFLGGSSATGGTNAAGVFVTIGA